MIRETRGNLLRSDAHALVNTVNCVGVMGKGIALAFKKRYPEMFLDYVRRCDRREVRPGHPYASAQGERVVINFPTKDHWRGQSRLEWIEEGLPRLAALCTRLPVRSLAVPPLGCGHGGLRWDDVRPLIHASLQTLDIPVVVYVPTDAAPHGEPEQSALFDA